MEPIIEFKDFTFKYRSQTEPTLRDINLRIYPGEKVLILGPSGSGKSTLAHCMNGLVPFSFPGDMSGSLMIAGKNPANESIFQMSKHVGTVLQDTDGQFIGLTVAEDIAFVLENDLVEQDEMHQRVNHAAELVDVKELLEFSPGELSGGQKQRVSMAGVLVDDVEILLFDEPLANLDPATGKHTIELIDRLQKKQNKTIVIIEHRLEDVLYCDVDRIIVVNDGRIIADSTPDELLAGSVLRKQGIREPLYVAALRYAGCDVDASSKLSHIEQLEMKSYEKQIGAWFNEVKVPEIVRNPESVLSLSDLCFSYVPEKKVLKSVGFSIQKGEMVSLVGKNGAGKTTISSLICGFLKPTSGSIFLNGKDISSLSVKERGEKIGLVMQNPNQMISKPMIFDEVALGLSVRGVPEEAIKERVHHALKICGLYPFRNWPVSALSFGQKKRVTIASVLVMNPEIMILDEPTAGQDYRHYTEFMEFLKSLNEDMGITIIMITHDMHLMLEYTDRAIVIADGEIIADDRPSKILTDVSIAHKAYLKETSLFQLALKCGMKDPSALVDCFIEYERKQRKGEKQHV